MSARPKTVVERAEEDFRRKAMRFLLFGVGKNEQFLKLKADIESYFKSLVESDEYKQMKDAYMLLPTEQRIAELEEVGGAAAKANRFLHQQVKDLGVPTKNKYKLKNVSIKAKWRYINRQQSNAP